MTTFSGAPAPGQRSEEDFPAGHPARADYDPSSPEALEWARHNVHPLGQRDFPVDHPAAADTPGNKGTITWEIGVDPFNPHREPFTGRTPEQVAGIRELSRIASVFAKESPAAKPVDALAVNAAMDAKRKLVGRDSLTEAEYSEVLATFHTGATTAESSAAIQASIEKQHQALSYLQQKGYSRNTALEMLARQGAERILAERDAATAGA